ncbi:hypothetical protein B0B51_07695 [blood disease bacterium A2-HR MARDI]|uniref:Uncharacterized protein n=1 Tax=blood disease bacterium A2-HR MARDI TaxID=1944648 RepID=A0A1U9VGR5_9RALS|nr:hypothetical protein B0B51_07695 [blood disease bacterium A2-HR MARDI]
MDFQNPWAGWDLTPPTARLDQFLAAYGGFHVCLAAVFVVYQKFWIAAPPQLRFLKMEPMNFWLLFTVPRRRLLPGATSWLPFTY